MRGFNTESPHSETLGNLALVRQVVEKGMSEAIEGVELSAPAATLILSMYEQLNPYAQEVFAAECNYEFWAATWKWFGQQLARELAQMMTMVA
jgi:hypothetical protein